VFPSQDNGGLRGPLRVIFDQVIELSLRADVRFDPESDQDRTATQYVAMGHFRTHALQQESLLVGHFVSAAKQRERNGNSERLAHPSLCLVNNANRETVT